MKASESTEYRKLSRAAAKIVKEELKAHKTPYDRYQATVLPLRTVGVMGDNRTYQYPVLIEVYHNNEAVLDHDLMGKIATRIPNEVEGINRVVWLLAKK